MSSITFIKGDILFSKAQTIVNPISCDGTVPCYLSKRFFARYPGMRQRYQTFCERKLLEPGKLWIHQGCNHKVLNFPIMETTDNNIIPFIIEKGLKKFLATYEEKSITSISFPLLCSEEDESKREIIGLMVSFLQQCSIPITIYEEYIPQSEVMIPLLTKLCGTLPEETILEIKEKICFE